MNSLSLSPLLSIVIPTKNRYETLLPTLNALLDNIVGTSYEIVVQDNSDNPAAANAYLKKRSDTRLQYAHQPGFISIVENTEKALTRARGTYITFIGDDDLVAPNILDFVQRFSDRELDAVIYPPAYYWWSSIRFVKPTRYHQPGALWYPPVTSTSEKLINTGAELTRVTSQGAVALFDLPRVYHGIVHRRVLETIKARTGFYVNGASPDMALAIAAAYEVSSHIKVDTPLTIYGASKNSGGGWTAAQVHFGKITDQPHLPQYTKDLWSELLPPIWSEHTIYPQTAMEVMRFMGRPDTINYGAFYASMLVNEPHLRTYVLPFVGRFLSKKPQRVGHFVFIVIKKLIGRINRAFRIRVTGLPFKLWIFETPDACMKHLIKLNRTRRC
jgi:glycosyltransferase involved in cell wall biosynthesis